MRRDVDRAVSDELHAPAGIPPPTVHSLGPGAGYVCDFNGTMARLTIDALRQGRDGVKGDVRVEVGPFSDGSYKPLTEARMELASISQRESWERRLRKRWPNIGWEEVLDQFCVAVMQAEKRLDRPAVWLRDAARPPATGMLLEPLLLAGLPTIWYGDGGTAKSYLALAAAVSLHLSIPVIGTMAPAQRLRVLYVDFEFDAWEHRERMRQLLRLEPEVESSQMPDIAYLDCKGGTIVSQVDRIRSAARECQAQFLVIDSISYAADGPLNEDETARVYYRALGYLGLPSLSTAHVTKAGDPESPFGSVHWKNLSRLAWQFHVTSRPTVSQLTLRLTNKKVSTGRSLPIQTITVDFSGDGVGIYEGEAHAIPAPAIWRQIKSLIGETGRCMSYDEIGDALTLTAAQVRARVAERKEAFMVYPAEPGRRTTLVGVKGDR